MTNVRTNSSEITSENGIVQAGMYFRAKHDIDISDRLSHTLGEAGHPKVIPEGTVMLVADVHHIDQKPHTVIFLPHPDWINFYNYRGYKIDQEIKFLIDDFAASFEFSMDAEEIRLMERAKAEKRIAEIQDEMRMLQENPSEFQRQYMLKQQAEGKTLPALVMPGRIVADVTGAIQSGEIEQFQRQVEAGKDLITFAATTITGLADKLSDAVKNLTPYYEELANVAIAKVSESTSNAAIIMDGVQTLDLWIGKGVEIYTIREGRSADPSIPIHVYQEVLQVAPEMSQFFRIHNQFSINEFQQFVKAINEKPELLSAMIPAERGVVAVCMREDSLDFGDSLVNMQVNLANYERFLLIKDGENLFVVDSPLWPHKVLPSLYPTKSQIDKIYAADNSGATITFRDLSYTKAVKQHEKIATVYKRLLVLLGGLQTRHKIFGPICSDRDALAFVSEGAQNKYMKFVHDLDGNDMLPGQKISTFREYALAVNKHTAAGHSIAWNANELMCPDSTPSAVVWEGDRRRHFRRRPTEIFGVSKVLTANGELITKVETQHEWRDTIQNSTVFMDKVGGYGSGIPFLNLDAVLPEELTTYIGHRESRKGYSKYIEVFKLARDHALAHEREHAEFYAMATAMGMGVLNDSKLVRNQIRSWRIANPGIKLTINPANKDSLKRSFGGLAEGLEAVKNGTFASTLEQREESLVLVECDGMGVLTIYSTKAEGDRNDVLLDDNENLRYVGNLDSEPEISYLPKADLAQLRLHVDAELYAHWQSMQLGTCNYRPGAKSKALALFEDLSKYDWLTTKLEEARALGSREEQEAALSELNKKLGENIGREYQHVAIPLALCTSRSHFHHDEGESRAIYMAVLQVEVAQYFHRGMLTESNGKLRHGTVTVSILDLNDKVRLVENEDGDRLMLLSRDIRPKNESYLAADSTFDADTLKDLIEKMYTVESCVMGPELQTSSKNVNRPRP
ncbi:hypothetical protein ACKF11_13085 [Methylobacillus sp. Pita2]|uniref:hypothetical protein n=1 Tax=Methylobacillus sp. Pita2 TaxID=3383245 RepID=UPI0038B52EDB